MNNTNDNYMRKFRFLGLPVYKIQRKNDKCTKKFYLLGLPVIVYESDGIKKVIKILGLRIQHTNKYRQICALVSKNQEYSDKIKQELMADFKDITDKFQKEYNKKTSEIIDKQTALIKSLEKSIFSIRSEINNNFSIIQERLLSVTDFKRALEIWYRSKTGHRLNLENPKTYNEKIQWLKLYDSTPEKTILADKYLVRDWVAKKIGEQYLIPLLGVYDSFDDIDFDKLPDRFVIKCNHGSGFNVIIKDKSKIDLIDVRNKINRWMRENFAYRYGYELHYRDIEPKIIIEQYIENIGTDDLYDYKFWCFNGKVYYIQFLSERNLSGLKMAFYDTNWKKQDFVYDHPMDTKNIKKPSNLDEMIKLAEKLAKGFNHVRVDFYRMNDGKLYFGEMTFTSASGSQKWSTESINQKFGDLIKLPSKIYDLDTKKFVQHK